MVSKTLSLDTWQFKAYSGLVAALRLRLAAATVTIVNVYNSIFFSNSIETWELIQQALEEAEGEILLLGDFNAHYPVWGGI
jgi:endonuclease/exonuclease/phosphatase family metal-dependent hydrolase